MPDRAIHSSTFFAHIAHISDDKSDTAKGHEAGHDYYHCLDLKEEGFEHNGCGIPSTSSYWGNGSLLIHDDEKLIQLVADLIESINTI